MLVIRNSKNIFQLLVKVENRGGDKFVLFIEGNKMFLAPFLNGNKYIIRKTKDDENNF